MGQETNIGAAYSKAARRRRKKAICGKRKLFGAMEAIEDMHSMRQKDNPLDTVRTARARHLSRAVSDDVLAPMLGDPCGQAISIGAESAQEASELWQVFSDLDAADEAFHRRILGKPRFAAVSKMEFMPERMETGPNEPPIDIRTEDERIAAARESWSNWCADLDKIYPWRRIAVMRGMRHLEPLHVQGKLTAAGRSFVAGIRSLHHVRKR